MKYYIVLEAAVRIPTNQATDSEAIRPGVDG